MDEFKGPGSTCLYDPFSEEVTKRLEWVETGVSGLMYGGGGGEREGWGVGEWTQGFTGASVIYDSEGR